ncbi:uncharacterized protein G2W53_003243 [Senna tora]|uniref:Uncharacterized protein n=1 Tax=Senna tora TaxID=362788 RepID=A0A835CI88_9FABA|nr:uncharacterized protein G2W53_003243 [Senna tora]
MGTTNSHRFNSEEKVMEEGEENQIEGDKINMKRYGPRLRKQLKKNREEKQRIRYMYEVEITQPRRKERNR